MGKLSPKRERFCVEYQIDSNGTQSAIRAGYSEKTANEQASRLLTKVSIQERIIELQAENTKECTIEAQDILNQLDSLRRANISDYVDLVTKNVWMGKFDDKKEKIMVTMQVVEFKDFTELTEEQLMCVESVKQGKNGIELKLHGKEWTIEKINRMGGFYEKDNRQKDDPITEIEVTIVGQKKRDNEEE